LKQIHQPFSHKLPFNNVQKIGEFHKQQKKLANEVPLTAKYAVKLALPAEFAAMHV
jgi:hypothetical protein